MAELTKAQFNTTYVNPSGTFADNNVGDIGAGDMQQFAADIKDSVQFKADDHWKGGWNWASNANAAPVAVKAGDTYYTEDDLADPFIPAGALLIAKIDGADTINAISSLSEYLIKP